MEVDGQPSGEPSGQPSGLLPATQYTDNQPSGQPSGEPSGQQGDDLTFKYSNTTQMSDFLKEYPQYVENPNFTKYKTVKEFTEGHEALLSKLGTAINIPDETATAEQLDSFYNKLGRPETPDKYTFEDNLPENWTIDKELDTEYRSIAHKLGITEKQAQGLREFYNKAIVNTYESTQKDTNTQLAKEHEENVSKIKEIWGQDYKAKTKIAMNTARSVLSQDTLDYLDATGLGNNATFVKDFYELSKRFSGDTMPLDGGLGTPQPKTLEDMASEAMKILKTPGWQNDPALKRKYEELTQQRADILYKE